MTGAGGVLLIVFALVGFGVYFFPVICAWSREHPNTTAIFVLNLLLGWTVIGWVGAMVWAFTNGGPKIPSEAEVASKQQSAPSMRKCPYCAEEVRAEAIKCKHCGSALDPLDAQSNTG